MCVPHVLGLKAQRALRSPPREGPQPARPPCINGVRIRESWFFQLDNQSVLSQSGSETNFPVEHTGRPERDSRDERQRGPAAQHEMRYMTTVLYET